MKKINIIRVDLTPIFTGHYGEQELSAILDMLRFAGLLRSNVQGFPKIIEYEAISGQLSMKDDIARWASFGFTATTYIEYR